LMAISCLTMAFSDDTLLNIGEQWEATDWPSDLAHIVIVDLFIKYHPIDIISQVEMRSKISKVFMKNDHAAVVRFNQLAISSAFATTPIGRLIRTTS
jgi:hypothetical protein